MTAEDTNAAEPVGSPVVRPVRPFAVMHEWPDQQNWASGFGAVVYHPSEDQTAEQGWIPLYSLTAEDVAAVNKHRAGKEWKRQRDLKACECDHHEYCRHCWPEDFRPGGMWHGLGA